MVSLPDEFFLLMKGVDESAVILHQRRDCRRGCPL
jgi:hypothetical protein